MDCETIPGTTLFFRLICHVADGDYCQYTEGQGCKVSSYNIAVLCWRSQTHPDYTGYR